MIEPFTVCFSRYLLFEDRKTIRISDTALLTLSQQGGIFLLSQFVQCRKQGGVVIFILHGDADILAAVEPVLSG